MTNNFGRLSRTLFYMFVLLFSISSCYNEISEELIAGDIPILITSNIKPAQTRAADNHFEPNDAIGFFLVPKGASFQEAFISNCIFEYKTGKDFVPKSAIYYPKTEEPSSIFAYYPYQKDAFDEGSGKLSVSIPHLQETPEILNTSELLIAEKKEVYAMNKAQELEFKHQLSKVELVLKPSDGYSAEEIQRIKPVITINNLPTTALLNPETLQFENLDTPKAITPLTNWVVDKELLVGSEFIALPHTLLSEVSISILAENITYTCSFPADFNLEPGTINKLVIKYTPSKGIEILNSESKIEEWGVGKTGETEAQELKKAISANQFSFDETNIIQLVNSDGKARVEVCLELIQSENISTQAVVIYPVDESGVRSETGLCIKTLDSQYDFNGYNIVWDKELNTVLVGERQEGYQNHFFISKGGLISFEETPESEILHRKKLFFNHQGVEYPLVKIGWDVWLAENFRGKAKLNGDLLAFEPESILINSGYTTHKDYPLNFLYNKAAIESNQLAPSGWHTSTESDWARLIGYIKEDFSLIKEGEAWVNSKWSNKSYFNLLRMCCYSKGKYTSLSDALWANTRTGKLKLVIINDHAQIIYDIREITTNDYMASVRFVRN